MKLKLIVLVMLLSGCAATKHRVSKHHNRIEQQMQQYHEGETSYQNWDRRPQGHWPVQFLY